MAARGQGGARRRRQRGAALLVVMVAVALVTVVAVELAYQARVSLRIAANARDELKAQAQARGAVALGRLVLHFQSKLDESAGRGAALAGALGGAGAQAQAQQVAAAMPRPQLWRLVPIDSSLAANLFGGGWSDAPGREGARPAGGAARGREAGGASAPEGHGAPPGGPADGTFQATIEDEDRKVNVQLDAGTDALLGAYFAAWMALVEDRRWDFLFDREDAAGQRTTRTDLAVHLKDWVDLDQVQAAVTGLPSKPFENGFGDENYVYDRGPDRYKAKNARFDSLDELFLVTGVSDALMAAFGDRLTVYLPVDAKMNINADSAEELMWRARFMASPPQQPVLSDPTFPERLQRAVRDLTLGGFLSITSQQFAQVLQSLGLSVDFVYTQATNVDQKGGFTDRSRVFTVRGTARVGDVEKAVEAVVTFDPSQARAQAGQLGRLLHWREE